MAAMSDEPIHHPHDKLFKGAFGQPANAAGFLRWQLPAALASHIDWDHLKLQPGSFVDSHYRHSESDLLFSAPLEESSECLIYLLFEHQLSQDPCIALRLLRYMVRIWEEHRRKNPQASQLPVILPVVLAQNAQAWEIATQFSSLLDIPPPLSEECASFVPDFTFRLIQLADLGFQAIRGTPAGILTLRVMKAERIARLLDEAVWDESLLLQVPQETLELLIRYILNADIDKAAFDRKVQSVSHPDVRTTAMSLAQQLRQEGRQEGRLEGRQELIIENLRLRFGFAPQGLVDAIAAIHDEAQLLRLHRASIQAASLEDFSSAL
jgi:predicted transposase/invertase (TIGR01784 family)